MVATLVGVSAINACLSLQRTRTQIAADLRQLAATLSAAIFPLTDAVLQKMRGLSGADFILTDARGGVLSSSAARRATWQLPLQPPGEPGTILGAPIVVDGRAYFHTAVPIRAPQAGRERAVLHMLYPKATYDKAWRESVYPPLLLGVLAVVLVGVVGSGIASRVTRPLRTLQSQVDEIAEGRFHALPTPKRDDELADLARCIDRMSTMLARYEDQVRHSEQLRTLGQLGGGLAHQLRNAVTGCRLAIERFRERLGDVPIIVITAYGDLDTAVRAVRNGAFEYLIKPFDLDQIQKALERALTAGSRAAAVGVAGPHVEGMIGSSPALQEVFKRIALAADPDVCVLLSGESGTGKELAARAIHKYSARSGGSFVAVNVASLSPVLAESELFGHGRGQREMTDQAIVALQRRPWYGTVCELRNAVEHATILARGGVITVGHLPPPAEPRWLDPAARQIPADEQLAALITAWAEQAMAGDSDAGLHDQLLALIEPPMFRAVLTACHGQVATAARRLGLHRTTLRKKLDQYGDQSE